MRTALLPLRLAPLALALFAAAPLPLAAQNRAPAATTEELVSVADDDPAMNAAIADARRTLPEFLKVVAAPPAGVTEIGFKYPLDGWEHIWVDNVSRRGNVLIGQLANEPVAKGYKLGQRVEVPLTQISDWAYRGTDGVMRGHRTTRVLLPQLSPEEAAQIRQYMGWE